jgi:hypothetical protein
MKTLVAITGKKGSGKTLVAKMISNFAETSTYSFAAPIKEMIEVLTDYLHVYGLDGDNMKDKRLVIPDLKVTLRELYQTLGTEWGRNMINPDIWVDCMRQTLMDSLEEFIVIPDMRFDNEYDMLKEFCMLNSYKFVPLNIVRDTGEIDNHPSEQGLHNRECINVANNGSIPDLEMAIRAVVMS